MQKTIKALESLFSISQENIIGIYKNKIAFLNPAAAAALPMLLVGADARRFIPQRILDAGAGPMAAAAHIGNRPCTVSVSGMNSVQLLLVRLNSTRREQPYPQLPASLTTSLRSALANVRLSGDFFLNIPQAHENEEEQKKARFYMAFLSHNCHLLQRMIVGCDTLGKLQCGTLPFHPCMTDLVTLTRELCDSINHFSSHISAAIEVTCEQPSLLACVDASLYEQLLLNLICNSLQSKPKSSPIRVSLEVQKSHAVISVIDDGCGIEPKILSSVFDQYAADKNLQDLSSHTGLGLAIVHGIAELHKGMIFIDSAPGRGTCVQVHLPQRQGASTTAIFREPRPRFRAPGPESLLTELSCVLGTACYQQKYSD